MIKNILKKFKLFCDLNEYLIRRNNIKKFLSCSKEENNHLLFYSKFIKKGDLVFDVGANVGTKTKLFLNLHSNVVCYEPQPELVVHLTNHLNASKRVVIEGKGISSKEGITEMYISDAHVLSSMKSLDKVTQKSGRFNKYKWNQKINVHVTTLDNEIRKYGCPSYIKIDVEGHEYEVLLGLNQPIKMISFEYTAEDYQHTLKCIDRLSKVANYSFNHSISENHIFENNQWIDPKSFKTELKNLIEKIPKFGVIFCKT